MKDIVNENDCLYSYHYSSEAQHVEKLSEMLMLVYADYKSGKLLKKQHDAMVYMERNSWKTHKDEWISLYEGESC